MKCWWLFSEDERIINNNLFRKGDEKRWYTQYPWKVSRDVLPKNDKSAYQSLLAIERIARANPVKGEALSEQIEEMIASGTAIQLSPEELEAWEGPYHFLPMVLVKGKKRYRVCFDAARSQCGYPPFNKHLHKGPDRFLNNLLSVISKNAFEASMWKCVSWVCFYCAAALLTQQERDFERSFGVYYSLWWELFSP